MKITRGRVLHCSPYEYEFIEAKAEIEFTQDEVPKGTTEEQWADDRLTAFLEDEVATIAAVTNRESFIYDYRYTDTETNNRTPEGN